MKRTLPRAQVVYQVVQMPPLADSFDITAVDQRARDVLTEMREGKLVARDFRQLAVVETSKQFTAELVGGTISRAATPAIIEQDTPQHVRIRAKLVQPGLLVLSDSFGEGWVATRRPADSIAGTTATEQMTIHRTNRCFRGVELPAGEWIVDFNYRPQSFYRGAILSVLAWLGLIAAAVIGSFRRGC